MLCYEFGILCADLSCFSEIVLYGAGKVASGVMEILLERKLFVSRVIVTRKQQYMTLHGIPIMEIDDFFTEIDADKRNFVVLIAAGINFEAEMVRELKKQRPVDYIRLSNYRFDSAGMRKIYMQRTADDWKKAVRDLMICGKSFISPVAWNERRRNKVVFLVSLFSPRVYKVAKALRKVGYGVICFLMDDAGNNIQIENEETFEAIVRSSDLCEILSCITMDDVRFLYLFSYPYCIDSLSFFSWLILARSILPLIVFEEYDTGKLYKGIDQAIIQSEKFCMENADIICDRAFEVEYLENIGYSLQGKRIQILDCCDTDHFADVLQKNTTKELSLCYAGGIPSNTEYPNSLYACWLIFASMCKKNRCHLHLYFSVGSWNDNREIKFADYFREAETNSFFHIHAPVPYDRLSDELAQYDYGIHPTLREGLHTDAGYYEVEKRIYAASNHVFDYMNAGIPIISSIPSKLMDVLEKDGFVLKWNIEDYDFRYLKEHRIEYKENCLAARGRYLMDHEIGKLLGAIRNYGG